MKEYKKPIIIKEEIKLQDVITTSVTAHRNFGTSLSGETTMDIADYLARMGQ